MRSVKAIRATFIVTYKTCTIWRPITKNKIATASSDHQPIKNSNFSLPSLSPSNSSHSNPWKLGLMYTEWVRKASRSVREGEDMAPNVGRSYEWRGRFHIRIIAVLWCKVLSEVGEFTPHKEEGAETSWPQLESKPGTRSYDVQQSTATTVPLTTGEKLQRSTVRVQETRQAANR